MKITKYISVLLAAFALSGCIRDNAESCPSGDGKIVIQIKMPTAFATRTGTRALDESMELDIATLDVLVFRDNGLNETFMYHVEPTSINDGANSSIKYFTVPMQLSDAGEKQRLVLLANIPSGNRSKLATIAENEEKQAALDKVLFSSAFEWTGSSLPMWGESEHSVIVARGTTGNAFGKIEMLYSMARIDVGLNANADWTAFRGIEHYSIQSVYLCNTNKVGYMAPHSDDLAAGLPTIPSAAEGNNSTSWSQYFNVTYAPQASNHLPATGAMHLIYASEYANKGKSSADVSYVVVGVRYDDPNDAVAAVDSWYRLDFYDRDPADLAVTRLDILRGHRYMFNITGVDGPGYPTMEEAASSAVSKMQATVVAWNETGIITGLEQSEYALSVSQADFKFNSVERTSGGSSDNKVDISTDYSGGWKVSKIVNVNPATGAESANGWLTVSATSGAANTTTTVSLLVPDYNSYTPRYGRIYIEAGKWTYVINVIQVKDGLSLAPKVFNMHFDAHPYTAIHNMVIVQESNWRVNRVECDGRWLNYHILEMYEGRDLLFIQPRANTTGSPRTGYIYITAGGYTDKITVTQGAFTNTCGLGGTAVAQNLGGTEYRTHVYGYNPRAVQVNEVMFFGIEQGYDVIDTKAKWDNYLEVLKGYDDPDEWTYKCFMVDNLKSGASYEYYDMISTYQYQGHGFGERGYYYWPAAHYHTQIPLNPCPEGWRMPTMYELKMAVNPFWNTTVGQDEYDAIYGRPGFSNDAMGQSWWMSRDEAFPGYYTNARFAGGDYEIGTPTGWGDGALWIGHSDKINYPAYGLRVNREWGYGTHEEDLSLWNMSGTIRCVKDEDYSEYLDMY